MAGAGGLLQVDEQRLGVSVRLGAVQAVHLGFDKEFAILDLGNARQHGDLAVSRHKGLVIDVEVCGGRLVSKMKVRRQGRLDQWAGPHKRQAQAQSARTK